MLGGWYTFCGASWCRTSVFFKLTSRPKIWAVFEKQDVIRCIAASVWAKRTASSAHSSSRISSSMVFVWACRRLRLNTLPSRWKRMYMQSALSRSSVVCWSIILNKMVNSVGARTQPCFTPFTIGKGCERLLLCLTPSWPSWSWMIIVRNFSWQPSFSRIFQSPCLLTVSNAFVRSTKVTYNALFCSRHISWICLRTNTLSVVPRLALKPHCVSEMWASAIAGTSRFSITLARILPATDRSVMPR